ncbi:MAG: hypothetical protein ABI858_02860 [Pseudoxanthomonas sp.]
MSSKLTITTVAALLLCGFAHANATSLPVPDGNHAVGVVRAEFVDDSRKLDAADPASGPRRIPAVVWYPAKGKPSKEAAAYLPEEIAATTLPALARNFGYAAEDVAPVGTARVQVRAGAPEARSRSGFPVVVFSHGLFLYPEQNTALATHLASHGYIVISIAHPGDSTDVRLQNGRLVPTLLTSEGDDPRFAESFKAIAAGADAASIRKALQVYREATGSTRLGRSLVQWREDTMAVARAITNHAEPQSLHRALAGADRGRLAFAGMSFGGATAATTCKRVDACRAAVNLDGQNFDPDLFDQSVERPLLLLLSDWPRYGLLAGQPRDVDFSPNDLAYERWSGAGADSDVLRVRLQGIRHLGFTDLVALLEGPKRDERVGDIAGDQALTALNDLTLAFLDVHLRDGDASRIASAIKGHPVLQSHVPTRLQEWMRDDAKTD